ncbi:aspartate aminotransferase family protein [Streptomyces sp. NPDC048179]|uniref:class-III pyridoxal-phosphate-dependent aminotransferase n=1 Tax=Streptomyces sp. NPDC048179 TaxID=3365506 RepID=UPI003722D049
MDGITAPRSGNPYTPGLLPDAVGGGHRRIAMSAGLDIVRGDGAELYDSAGTAYIDCLTGYGVAALGHANRRWTDALARQARQLAVCPFYNGTQLRYLAELRDYAFEETDQVALYSGGTEATEAAVRLAQTFTGRAGIVTFRESFHGKTAAVRFAGGQHIEDPAYPAYATGRRILRYPECENHNVSDYEQCLDDGGDTLAELSGLEGKNEIAAVMVEPILGTAGNIPPDRLFFARLRKICTTNNWLLIFDESLTAMGRVGKSLASHWYGVVPDITVLGKAIGNGFPLSAVVADRQVWQNSALSKQSATSSSYGGNPMACAAGQAVLAELRQPGFMENVNSVASRFAAGLQELAGCSDVIARPRGVGLMLAFDLVDPSSGRLATQGFCQEMFGRLRAAGLLVAADVPRVRLYPPFTLSVAQADQILNILSEVLVC